MIPFLDLTAINHRHSDLLQQATKRVLDSGYYILGSEVAAFEKSFAEYCQRQHCIGVANGLDALILILRAAVACGKLRPGSEVIVSANTYIASVLAILHAGLVPKLVEADEDSFNLSAKTVDSLITANTGAVMTVHLYGQASDMVALEEVCQRHKVFLLSDAAQAHGAKTNGKPATVFGDAAAFSFYPGKNLGALGDGGAAVTDDEELAKQISCLRNYGSEKKYENAMVGVNSRLDEMQAALLSVKLPFLDADNARRRQIATRYQQGILHKQILLPQAEEVSSHVWHVFVIRCQERDKLQQHLQDNSIGTLIHYPIPPHRQAAFAGMKFVDGQFPLAEKLGDEVLSLPLNPVLSDLQVDNIITAVNNFVI